MSANRYARQVCLPEVGIEGQERLRQSTVAIIGMGGLGCPAAQYLAAAGVGTLILIDPDRVDRTNLQRQVLYGTDEQGELKVEAAARRLKALNPEVSFVTHALRLSAANAVGLLSGASVIIDGTDNFAAKFLINDAAIRLGVPLVYGSLSRFEGRVGVFDSRQGACYRCLHPTFPRTSIQNCAEAGVLGAVAGVIGAFQAAEALKLLLGHPSLRPLQSRLAVFDSAQGQWLEIAVPKRPDCPACSSRSDEHPLTEYDLQACATAGTTPEISAHDLRALLASGRQRDFIFVDVREQRELAVEAGLPGAIHLPLSHFRPENLEAAPETPVIVYCQKGIRSQVAAEKLRAAGFRNVVHLAEGLAGLTTQA